jgi:hypothetical protein
MAAKSNRPVQLYTAPTPNGWVPAILLEEFKVCAHNQNYDISINEPISLQAVYGSPDYE